MPRHRVCPWWIGYVLLIPFRRLRQDPARILAPYVRTGMTVLEPGPGMGFFTLELARLVGATGRVVAVDVQPRMLARLKRRAERAGVASSLDARVVQPHSMGLEDLAGQVDFVFAFFVLHELPSARAFFAEAAAAMRPGARLLLAEPTGHVKRAFFEAELADAAAAGLSVVERPRIRRSYAAVLERKA